MRTACGLSNARPFRDASVRGKKEEALDNIKEAAALCLEVQAERGVPLTLETLQLEVVA